MVMEEWQLWSGIQALSQQGTATEQSRWRNVLWPLHQGS